MYGAQALSQFEEHELSTVCSFSWCVWCVHFNLAYAAFGTALALARQDK